MMSKICSSLLPPHFGLVSLFFAFRNGTDSAQKAYASIFGEIIVLSILL